MLQSYIDLLNQSYGDAVKALQKKYGDVSDDYYKEKSYKRFLDGEIKSIAKGNYSKTSQGLYCHHIAEDRFQNMSDHRFIVASNIPYKYQQRDYLVYCDLLEHLILHAQITKKTKASFGYTGYLYLYDMVYDWYIAEKEPKPEWMKQCKNRVPLSKTEIDRLLTKIEKYLAT